MEKEKVAQPSMDAQKLLNELVHAEKEEVDVDGKKVSIGWLHKDTENRISRLMFNEDDTELRLVKWYSLVRLDVRSGLLTWILGWSFYWLYWRWLWYVKRERCTRRQVEVVSLSKKKIKERSHAFVLITILTVEAMDTMMMRARHEVGQAEQVGESGTR